jgi:hypothetical protein
MRRRRAEIIMGTPWHLRLGAAWVLAALLTACGGGGGGDPDRS